MSEYMTGAQAAIAQLVAEWVTDILSIPGEHNLFLCDAVLDYPQLRLLTSRHEQGLAYMSNGYARVSHKIAVPIVISGPGVTNSLTALGDAYQDSVPMVLIATQAPLAQLGKGAFHEIKDQSGVLVSMVKWHTRVESVEEIPNAIRHAFIQAYTGRPGPTAIEIPLDIQSKKAQVDIYPSVRPSPLLADKAKVREASYLLAHATMPMIYVGRGAVISGCADELRKLVESFNIPCFNTALAKGILPEDHPLNLSWGGCKYGLIREMIQKADVVLVIGSSLDDSDATRFSLQFPKKLIQIDTNQENVGRYYPVHLDLMGDAKQVLTQLLSELNQYDKPDRSSTNNAIGEYKAQGIKEKQPTLAWQFISAIQKAISKETIVFGDPSWVNGWTVYFLDRHLPNTFHCPRNFCGLGFSFSAALGAKVAFPERQILSLIGDGGFLFSNAELATAVQYQLNIVTIIFNDQGYGSIKRRQEKGFGRTIGVDLPAPDFVKMAEAFGAIGVRAETPEQLYSLLKQAWEYKRPTIIEVPLDNSNPSLNV
ncbi:MAG: thiamine pyrophosphate-binding protein [Candidatus Parabeggiatoa sp.]|nr:thiamine pyrophosphate-binding protein [Candidatus Parabeggiatoa sp.]